MIRPASVTDAAAVCSIYNKYVLNTYVTFEEEAVSEETMALRIRKVTASLPWFVIEEEARVVGYAYAAKWHHRTAYRYAAESTVYLDQAVVGRGLGAKLYETLLSSLHELGMHCIIGGIALPNVASQRLHEKCGFKKVAHYEQVGWKFGSWIDVGYWELLLPRKMPNQSPQPTPGSVTRRAPDLSNPKSHELGTPRARSLRG